MAQYPNLYNVELTKGPAVVQLQQMFLGDALANRIGAIVTENGEAVTLGGTCSGTAILSNGGTVSISGTVSGNTCYIDLPSAVYVVEGPVEIFVSNVSGGKTTTLVAAFGNVRRTQTGSIIDPGTIIPSVSALIDAIDAAVASIPADYTALLAAVAPTFSASADYAAGRYVWYSGDLYRFTADHAAGSWTGTDAEAAKVGNGLADLQTDFDNHVLGTFGHGLNYYNYKAVNTGYVLRTDGTQSIIATGYTSDFIPVEANTVYNKRYIFNSSTIADVAFYDANKAFLSAFYGSGTVKYFTTPANCAYIRICGYTSDIKSEFVYKGQNARSHEYYQEILLPSAGGGDIAYLFAQSKIVFDSTNNQLVTIFGSDNIYLHIPGLQTSTLYPPVAVSGSGSTLYYNKDTNSFYRSNDDVINNSAVFRLGILGQEQARSFPTATMDGMYFVANRPLLLYDVANFALSVKIKSDTYIWHNKTYGALTAEEYDLPLQQGRINCVYFNLATKKFVIANDFGAYGSQPDFAPIGFIYGAHVSLSVPFAVLSGEDSQCGKTALTYGDSLTWYDGHAFTWGPHEGEICRGYQTYLSNILGIACTNRGASGNTTPQIVANMILGDSSRIASVDYVILMPSIMNDDRLSVSPGTVQPIGGTFDAATTAGALQTAIEYIYSVKQDSRIVLIVEPMGFTYRDGTPNLCNEQFPAVIRSVAALYGIPCIDLWAKSGINALTRNIYYADPTFESGNTDYMYHPNNFGWEVLSRLICEEMKKY